MRRANILHAQLHERNALISAVMSASGATGIEDLFSRLDGIKTRDILLRQMEDRQAILNRTNSDLRDRLQKTEDALRTAHRSEEEAQAKANTSGRAMVEVCEALSFPVDTVNRALLFTENLERDEKLNRGQIIRFLMDHSRRMEKTWSCMQELVWNMFPPPPIAQGSQVPEDSAATPGPVAGVSQTTPVGFNDMVGTPDFVSPMSWSTMSLPNSETLRKWQSAMQEGWSPMSPPSFRIPSKLPSPDQRRRALPEARPTAIEVSPSASLQDLPQPDTQTTACHGHTQEASRRFF